MWKKEVKQTRRTRSGRRSFEDLLLYLSRSLPVALTVAAKQPPLWPGQDNRAQAAPRNQTETVPKPERASAIWLYCVRCLNIYEVLQYL